MTRERGRISLNQAIFLVVTAMFSPFVQLMPSYTTRFAGQAAWVSAVWAFVIFLPIIFILGSFAKKYSDMDFIEIMDDICGKVISRIFAFIYLAMVVMLAALYLRYYCESLLSTALPYVSPYIFLTSMAAVVWAAARKSTVTFARMNEIMMCVILLSFIVCSVFSVPSMNIRNFLPVSYLDIVPSLRGSVGVLAVWSYIPIVLLFLPNVNGKENINAVCMKTHIAVFAIALAVMAVTEGVLGSGTAAIVQIPFFTAVKQISVFGYIERIESLVVSLWVISDFTLITLFITLAYSITKRLFGMSGGRSVVSAYIFIIFPLSMLLGRSVFELQNFSNMVVVYLNVILGIGVPAAVFLLGKIRRRL